MMDMATKKKKTTAKRKPKTPYTMSSELTLLSAKGPLLRMAVE
jgi:hypothetical protein